MPNNYYYFMHLPYIIKGLAYVVADNYEQNLPLSLHICPEVLVE